jgi:hypothetical protein
MKTTITFNQLNKRNMLGTKFNISGSDTVYEYDTCQVSRNGYFTAKNTKFGTNSKIGINANLVLIN